MVTINLIRKDSRDYYTLKSGEKAVVIRRAGKKIGSGWCHYVMSSIAIERPDGSKVYMSKGDGYSPYWIAGTGTFVAHWKSGMNKRDFAAYQGQIGNLQARAAEINNNGYFERRKHNE